EYVAEMSTAVAADHLFPDHPVAVIGGDAYLVPGERQPEAGPAGTGIVLVLRAEEPGAANDTTVGAVLLVVHVTPGERALGALFLGHAILLVGQPLSQVVAHVSSPPF